MENKVIVISESEFFGFLNPLIQRLDKMETLLLKNDMKNMPIYSELEASKYLKVSTKKLQLLRNARKIGFIREDGGRKISYKHEHLMD